MAIGHSGLSNKSDSRRQCGAKRSLYHADKG